MQGKLGALSYQVPRDPVFFHFSTLSSPKDSPHPHDPTWNSSPHIAHNHVLSSTRGGDEGWVGLSGKLGLS